VVRAAIRLANELRIACLAEGVESVEQVNFLKAAGCAFGQGNYFGRPLSGERMTAMLAERAARPSRATLQLERTAG
jgi:EAL domain-containing protein (putative c-di-GMP-specific phosphodiesterase class I)